MKSIYTIIFLFLIVELNSQIIKTSSKVGRFETVNTFPTLGDEGQNETINVEYFYQVQANYDTGIMKIIFYNLDLTEYKTVNISVPNGYKNFELMYVTTKFFNNDEKIEFIYTYSDMNYITYIYKLSNENGENLFDFGNEVPSNNYTTKNGDFIFTTSSQVDNVRYTNFYSTQKNQTQTKPLSLIKRLEQPYPNPAAQTINLPYQLNPGERADMQIYDVNGKLVATKRIDAAFDKIVLNVSGYEKGMYVYKYNGKSAKFVVE